MNLSGKGQAARTRRQRVVVVSGQKPRARVRARLYSIAQNQCAWFDQMPAGSLRGLVIETDDLALDYEQMTSLGVAFLGPPAPQPGGTFATFVDPDGNQISLRQADSPLNL